MMCSLQKSFHNTQVLEKSPKVILQSSAQITPETTMLACARGAEVRKSNNLKLLHEISEDGCKFCLKNKKKLPWAAEFLLADFCIFSH